MGGLFQLLLGRGGDFQDPAHFLVFSQCLETVRAPLGVSFHLRIEEQILVLSAILVPFDSNWFVLCPWLCHSFKSCALPLSLLLQCDMKIIRSLYLSKVVLLIKLLEDECNNCL